MTAPPLPDYDRLDVPQVRRRLRGLTTAELTRVESYELAHRRRSSLLTTLARLLRCPAAGRVAVGRAVAVKGTMLSQEWEVGE